MEWVLRGILVAALAMAGSARADNVEDFCSIELVAAIQVAHAEREEAAKDDFLKRELPPFTLKNQKPKDEFLASLRAHIDKLESRIEWGSGKTELIRVIREVILSEQGNESVKSELASRADEAALVSFSDFLPVLEHLSDPEFKEQREFLPRVCGDDLMGTGGLAFWKDKKKVFAFCPGALLRASVTEGKWLPQIRIEGLLFTAFHELGHVLGADRANPLRSNYSGLLACLHRQMLPFGANYEDEVLADFWGAVSLVKVMEEQSIHGEEAMNLVAKNLAPFRNGSMFSPHHLPFGGRQQLILTEVCRHLRKEPRRENECRFQLGAQ